MRTMKKLCALLLALVMCMGLCATALAADAQPYGSSTDTTFSITVTNAANGETYNAYKIFDVTYDDEDHYSYTIDTDSVWYSTVANATDVFTLTQVNDSTTYIVSVIEGVEDAAVIAVFTEANIDLSEVTADATAEAANDQAVLDVTNSGPGYYYVTTSLGSLVMIDTTNPTQEISEKNGKPTLEKWVHENTTADDTWQHEDDAYNEETVLFEINIKNISGAVNLVLHDSMDDELEIPDETNFHMKSVTLYTSADADGIALVEGTDYIITVGNCTNENCELGNCAFEVKFLRDFSDVDETGYIKLTYELLLDTENDEYNDDYEEIDNNAQITYGTSQASEVVQAETYSFGFEIYKYSSETTDAVTIGISRVQNWFNYLNVYSGSAGGVKSVYLDPGTYVFSGGFEAWDTTTNPGRFSNFDEFALLEVTGKEPTANIQNGTDEDGNPIYDTTTDAGGYEFVYDEDGGYVYDIIQKNLNGEWVVTIDTPGIYVLVGFMYEPLYHGDVGGRNIADWEFSNAILYCVGQNKEISKIEKDSTGNYVYTLKTDESKVTATTSTVSLDSGLDGAKFEVSDADGKIAYFKYEEELGIYLFEGWLEEGDKVPEGCTSTLVSESDGGIKIEGLDTGIYTLTEIEAPEGYNKLTQSITVKIWAEYDETTGAITDHGVTWYIGNDEEGSEGVVNVENNTGSILPGTGGIGTTLFYLIGAILACGAAVILITRRRMRRLAA